MKIKNTLRTVGSYALNLIPVVGMVRYYFPKVSERNPTNKALIKGLLSVFYGLGFVAVGIGLTISYFEKNITKPRVISAEIIDENNDGYKDLRVWLDNAETTVIYGKEDGKFLMPYTFGRGLESDLEKGVKAEAE